MFMKAVSTRVQRLVVLTLHQAKIHSPPLRCSFYPQIPTQPYEGAYRLQEHLVRIVLPLRFSFHAPTFISWFDAKGIFFKNQHIKYRCWVRLCSTPITKSLDQSPSPCSSECDLIWERIFTEGMKPGGNQDVAESDSNGVLIKKEKLGHRDACAGKTLGRKRDSGKPKPGTDPPSWVLRGNHPRQCLGRRLPDSTTLRQ